MATAGTPGQAFAQFDTVLDRVRQGADQVKRIVRDLLTYSRSQPEQLESVDVHARPGW